MAQTEGLSGPARRPLDYVAVLISTCGVGFVPVAPGTLGSLVGVGLFCLVQEILPHFAVALSRSVITAGVALAIFYLGIWSSSSCERIFACHDSGKIVIDEVLGQFLTFAFLPSPLAYWQLVLGFLLFRFFDIAKPFPIRRFESLAGGLGVMADDALAGLYSAIVLLGVTSLL